MEHVIRRVVTVVLILAGGICLPRNLYAQDQEYAIIIKNHIFIPSEVKIPANKKVKLIIENQDPMPEEFESDDLNREKMVVGNGKISVFIGPLSPGSYRFFGEFHQDTAQGIIIAE